MINTDEVFGIEINYGNYDSVLDQLVYDTKTSVSAIFMNSHMVYEYFHKQGFKGVVDSSSFVFPDGVPLLHSLNFFTNKKSERIAGNDIALSLIQKAESRNLSMFWIGSKQEVLSLISTKLAKIGVHHQVYSPPFLKIEKFDFEYQANLINDFGPDLIMVGLGCPKQEIWMHNMRSRVNAPMFGVGGAFLLYAGIDSRAPKLMRTLSLEWLYRLILEPKRLFKRYLITNTYFCWLLVKEIFKIVTKKN